MHFADTASAKKSKSYSHISLLLGSGPENVLIRPTRTGVMPPDRGNALPCQPGTAGRPQTLARERAGQA